MGTVSIIIPCYNLGAFLPEAVASARAHTRPASEIAIIDDGSTDQRTLALLDRFRGEGLAVLRAAHQGLSATRNHGISRARGEYILCLDADDILMPTFLEET